MTRLILTLLVAVPLVTAAQDTSSSEGSREDTPAASPQSSRSSDAPGPKTTLRYGEESRQGVYAGVGFGGELRGYGTWRHDRTGIVLKLRVGAARSDRVQLGFEGGLSDGGQTQLSTYDVGATFFPRGSGFFLRGAVGMTTLARTSSSTERGANVLAGVGWAVGLRGGLALTLNADGQLHLTPLSIDGSARNGLASASLWLGVDWK